MAHKHTHINALICLTLSMGYLDAVTYTVTNLTDSAMPFSADGSLRAAILNANDNPGATNTIVFTTGSGTITLAAPLPPFGSNISTVNLGAQTITLNGNSASNNSGFVFRSSNSGLTIQNGTLNVSNTNSVGGNGGGGGSGAGGGAGLGAGGGLFVGASSTVTFTIPVSFSNCSATGGNGGSPVTVNICGGNGGGGMGGGAGGNVLAAGAGANGGGGGGFGNAAGGSANGSSGVVGASGGGGGGVNFAGGGGVGGSTSQGGGGGGSDSEPGNIGGTGGSTSVGGIDLSGAPGGTANGGNAPTGSSSGGGGGGSTNSTGGNAALLGGLGGGGAGSGTLFGGGGGGVGGGGGAGSPNGFQPGGAGGSGGYFGGGGGGGAGSGTGGVGGAAGFGGGGGGGAGFVLFSGPGCAGGNGGYGGGGGGGGTGVASGTSAGGSSGFAGGAGGSGGQSIIGAGGGGGALGGTIFVDQQATLVFQTNPTIISALNPVTFGSGGTGIGTNSNGGNGSAFGPDIFIRSSGLINFNFSSSADVFVVNSNIESDQKSTPGGGGIRMSGQGGLSLFGTNTYTGSTQCNGGTVVVLSDAGLGSTSPVSTISFDGGTLQIAGTFSTSRNIAVNSGGGTLLVGPGITLTVAASITNGVSSGPLTKTGTGTLALTLNNSFSGGLHINNGIVTAISNQNLGSSSSTLTFNGGTLEMTMAFDTPVNKMINLSGGGTIQVDMGSSTLMGNLIGAGALTKTGSGTLTLTSTSNSYNGTNINQGILSVSSDSNLGTGSGSISFGGGTLEMSTGFSTGRAIILNSGGGTVQVDSGTGALTAAISGMSGSLTKTGSGTLALTSGSNSYGGGTIIDAGTLSVASDANLGTSTTSITFNGGTLEFLAGFTSSARPITLNSTGTLQVDSGTVALNSIISGAGGVIKTGSGILQFFSSAMATYGGTTEIADGTLAILSFNAFPHGGNLNLSGSTAVFDVTSTMSDPIIGDLNGVAGSSILLGGGNALVFGTNTPLTTFAGTISGTGTMQKGGSGTVIFSGTNSYPTTQIDDGTLSVSADANLGGSSLVFIGGTLEMSSPFSLGSGVTLSGAGTIQVDTGDASLTGAIMGSGPFNKTGSGTLILTNVNNYTSSTNVSAGTLIVNGSIPNSAITVGSAGTLGGTGTVANVTVNGTLAPGNSIGTINVASTTFNPGSNYLVELDDTSSDLIAATGTVTIDSGAKLTLSPLGLTSPLNSYTIISATGGVNAIGHFTLINPTIFNFNVVYDPTDVMLILAGMKAFTASGNAGRAANCFNQLITSSSPTIIDLLTILSAQTPSQQQNSFNQMQPANLNNFAFAQENVAERTRQVFTEHMYEARLVSCPESAHWRFWATPFAEWAHQQGHGSLKGYRENFAGFTAAADYLTAKHWIVSTGFSFAGSNVDIPQSHGNFKTYAGSLATLWTSHGWFIDGLFSYLYSPIEATRRMKFSATDVDTLKLKAYHNQASNQVMGHTGFGYNYTFSKNCHIYPFADLDYIYVIQNGYKEKYAHNLDLQVREKKYDLLRPEGGIGFDWTRCYTNMKVLVDLAVSYAREIRFLGKSTKSNFVGESCTFTVKGLKPTNNLVCPTGRIGIGTASELFTFTVGYHGEYGSHFKENEVEVELRSKF